MGESWHNNHHAFPASARHGLYPGQTDIGFAFIRLLARLGLAWNIQTPQVLPPRDGIHSVAPAAQLRSYQRASRWLTPLFQSDSRVLAAMRDKLLAKSLDLPAVRRLANQILA